MLLPELTEAIFLKRISRFSAEVLLQGKKIKVYVPNSGRMKELLREGVKVYLSRVDQEGRVTAYDLLLAEYDGTLVSIDSRVPNLLLAEAFSGRQVIFWDNPVREFRKESTFLNSRFDFKVILGRDTNDGKTAYDDGETGYVEAKSVTLVEQGMARFPDAPTERGSRHLKELAEAVAMGYRAAVVFVIQRQDAREFTPNVETDPEFAENLWRAKERGVELHAIRCRLDRQEIKLDQPVPVVRR